MLLAEIRSNCQPINSAECTHYEAETSNVNTQQAVEKLSLHENSLDTREGGYPDCLDNTGFPFSRE
jgi:hypothetical protein